MSAMDRTTGRAIGGEAEIGQSVAEILTTPKGSCIMRHEFGSDLFKLVDAPLGRALPLLLFAATAIAIRRWEHRVRPTRVSVEGLDRKGAPTLTINGYRTDIPGKQPFSVSLSL